MAETLIACGYIPDPKNQKEEETAENKFAIKNLIKNPIQLVFLILACFTAGLCIPFSYTSYLHY